MITKITRFFEENEAIQQLSRDIWNQGQKILIPLAIISVGIVAFWTIWYFIKWHKTSETQERKSYLTKGIVGGVFLAVIIVFASLGPTFINLAIEQAKASLAKIQI